MLTYHITTRVESDGSVRLRNLPPDHRVEIFVVQPEQADIQADMTAWFADVRKRHPFANMTKDEILDILRQTREEVWNERHADQS